MRIFRTIITEVTDEGAIRFFTGSGEAGGTIKGEFIQQIGFKSPPQEGDSGLVIQDGERVYLIATDNEEGPSGRAFYFDTDNYVKFVVSGGVLQKIHVNTQKDVDIQAVGNVTVSAPVIKLGLTGFLAVVTLPFIAWFNAHTHKESGGGETLVPTQQAVPAANTSSNTLVS